MTTLIERHRDEGEATWMLNTLVTTKATAEETGGAYSLTEHLLTPAGNPPPHVHHEEDEAFFVLDGEVDFDVDGVVVHGRPGTYALAPRGVPHSFRVLTETARMLVLASGPGAVATGGAEAFFSAVGQPAPARVLPEPAAPDLDHVVGTAARHGIEILLP